MGYMDLSGFLRAGSLACSMSTSIVILVRKCRTRQRSNGESMTVNSRNGGEFTERTDNVAGDVTLFARCVADVKLSTVRVQHARDERLAQSFAFCLGEDK